MFRASLTMITTDSLRRTQPRMASTMCASVGEMMTARALSPDAIAL
jgi:hypothetical protein